MIHPDEKNPAEGQIEAKATPSTELAPLAIIRTETVLSRLPIHNLVKRGTINIQITRKNGAGELDLSWRVSPSRDYGEPRQVAYKLDTIVVNRRIDELGRPLPRIIRLGSLRDVADELGLGKGNTSILRRALLQNAGSLITAKLAYRAQDGTEKRLEAAFTRYSVIFTGEKLPDGRAADAVHVILNEPYWEVLNNAPFRPLDYDYLKALAPTAQRFYEIVSYRIFAALKNTHELAKLAYSEYCTYSAQPRYYDYDRFKKQMYKVHRPHLRSGYLKSVKFVAATDGEGRPDWLMYYEPGAKSKAAHRAFTAAGGERALPPGPRAVPSEPIQAQPPAPASSSSSAAPVTALGLVQEFHHLARGVENYQPYAGSREVSQAAALLRKHGPEQARFIVGHAVRAAERTNFDMRNFGAVRQYVEEGQRAYDTWKRGNEARERERAEAADWRRAEERLEALPADEYQARYERARARLAEQFPAVATRYEGREGGALENMIRARMIEELSAGG